MTESLQQALPYEIDWLFGKDWNNKFKMDGYDTTNLMVKNQQFWLNNLIKILMNLLETICYNADSNRFCKLLRPKKYIIES